MSALRTTLFAAGFMALGALAATTTSALARPGGDHGGPPVLKFGQLLASLDLDETQEAALLDLREDLHDEMKASHTDRRDELKTLAEGIKSGNVDRAAIHSVIDAESAARTELAHRVTDQVLDVYDTLTPEQHAALVSRLETIEALHDEMRERKQGEDGDSSRRHRGH